MCKKLIFLVSLVFVLGPITRMASADITTGLVGHWKLDEVSGNIAYDSSGNGNDGTIIGGGSQWVVGHIGGALNLSGGDYVTMDGLGNDITDNDCTYSGWVKTTVTADTYWFSCNTSGRGNVALWGIDASGVALMYDGGKKSRSTTIINDGQWHLLTFTREGTLGTTYVDGFAENTYTTTAAFNFSPDDLWSLGQEWDGGGASNFLTGVIDDARFYDRPLTEADVQQLFKKTGTAFYPKPDDGQTDVPRDVVLTWEAGEFAAATDGHTVYLSESFNDVNDGIGGIAQSATSYDLGRLEFGTTYYWRVDEVNAPPDSTVYAGEVWSFTTEPVGYPVENITATASSSSSTEEGPENTINGSGLDDNDLHSTDSTDMWLSGDEQNAWIEYELDKVHKLHEMLAWNSNQPVESLVGLGIKAATVEYSVDGNDWTALVDAPEFSRAPGAEGYAANTTVDFAGAAAKYVKITANSNWGGILTQFGLSEVRFFSLPVWPREPDPVSGTTGMDEDNVTLSWRAGREAASHEVHLSTDEQYVIDSNAPVATVSETSYDTGELELGTTYYWKVNEVNDAETPTTWQGDVSNFSTQEYLVVETFENYNDISPDRMFETWIDGFGSTGRRGNGSGSIVGYIRPPHAEQSIVHGAKQSMALFYDNCCAAGYSEATANVGDLAIDDVPVDLNWTKHGIKTLSLWFYGVPSNAAEQMYVKVNGSKVLYDGDATNLAIASWQPWNIELADFDVDLSNVTELGIGFERSGETGGSGMVYFDDIRLYSYSRQFITPAEPNQTGLVGHYEFEGNTNDSAADNHGTVSGGSPTYVEGKIGGAMKFNGDKDQIALTYPLDVGSSSNTVAVWIKVPLAGTEGLGATERVGLILGNYPGSPNTNWELHSAGQMRLYWNGGQINQYGTTDLRDNTWHHVAWVRDKATNAIYMYIDGQLEKTIATLGSDITFNTAHSIAADNRGSPPNWHGLLDDIQIYSRALSQEEIASLAGRTLPFDKPF